MSENLFLGDSTYLHTPEQTLPMRLRCNEDNGLTLETDCLMSEAADRIEQLERELAEAQKDTKRYYWLQDWIESRTNATSAFCKAVSRQEYDAAIDAAINGVKA